MSALYVGRTVVYPYFVDKENIQVEEDDGLRYSLRIPFLDKKEKGKLVVILKNPSSATASDCDNTISKVCNVAHNNGYSEVFVLNLFPVRATYAEDVRKFYGCENYESLMNKNLDTIKQYCNGADVVFAWGTDTIKGHKEYPKNYDEAIKKVIQNVEGNIYFVKQFNCTNRDKKVIYPLHGLRWANNSNLITFKQ